MICYGFGNLDEMSYYSTIPNISNNYIKIQNIIIQSNKQNILTYIDVQIWQVYFVTFSLPIVMNSKKYKLNYLIIDPYFVFIPMY